MPLKGIPQILSAELLKILAEMGHGDTIVLADSNFPAASVARAKGASIIHMQAQKSIADLLAAVVKLLPLDSYECPAYVMAMVPSDEEKGMQVPVWQVYQDIMSQAEHRDIEIQKIERFQFYEVSKSAYAVVSTGDATPYGNIILKKGVLPPE
eukprot:TRINITY_DN2774_c0_g1_i1.p1 TRINITY_DN2774_c0_g1~~TRINITY_DN2774_c0_g1_i1.p1  ORF type:complete len:153 (+),score=22.34 TRINITY_DN2774_c0_g1_i1:61-519(+)